MSSESRAKNWVGKHNCKLINWNFFVCRIIVAAVLNFSSLNILVIYVALFFMTMQDTQGYVAQFLSHNDILKLFYCIKKLLLILPIIEKINLFLRTEKLYILRYLKYWNVLQYIISLNGIAMKQNMLFVTQSDIW